MITADYRAERGVQNDQKSDDVICKRSLTKVLLKGVLACNLIQKESSAQVFSYEFCKVFKNTFPFRTPKVAAPETFSSLLLIYGTFKNKNFDIILYV